jgi:hypothetical protein
LEFLCAETIQICIDGQRAQLFAEFQAGIWDQAEYREKLEELLNPPAKYLHTSSSTHPRPPCEFSPDWPETLEIGETAEDM